MRVQCCLSIWSYWKYRSFRWIYSDGGSLFSPPVVLLFALPCPAQPDEAFLHGILFNFHIINFENPSFCDCQCRRWSDNGFVRSYRSHSSQREESDNSTSGRRNHVCLQFLSTSLWCTSETEIFYMDDASIHLSIRWSVWPFVQPATRRWRYASTTGRMDGRIGLTDDCNWIWINIHLCVFARVSVCVFLLFLYFQMTRYKQTEFSEEDSSSMGGVQLNEPGISTGMQIRYHTARVSKMTTTTTL